MVEGNLKLRKFRYFLLDPKTTYPILMKLLKRELTQAEKVRLEDYIMKNYVIYTVGGNFKIVAAKIIHGDDFIKFYNNGDLVAIVPVANVYIVVESESLVSYIVN